MRILSILASLLVAVSAHAEELWKTVDEGFQLIIPESWQKKIVKGIDSHCGAYSGNSADLEFDEVSSLLCPVEAARSLVDEMKKKEADPKLLESGEEIWHVDGRIARFRARKVDPKLYGDRRFANVGELQVGYADAGGSLRVLIFYKNENDLPTVRRVLQGIVWKKAPNKKEDNPTQSKLSEGVK